MEKLHPYAVTLVFGGGPIVTNVLLSPSPEAAVATLFSEFVRGPVGVPKEPLTGVAVCPISLEWLRLAIQKEAPAQVVHLLPATTRCSKHAILLDAFGQCHLCTTEKMQTEPRCLKHDVLLDATGKCPLCVVT